MAITSGNKTYLNPTPSSTTYTYSTHSQNVGSGGFMVVVVASMADFGRTITGITWNGVSMTQMQQGTISSDGQSTRLAFFKLADPATGTNDLTVTWSDTMDYGCSIQIFSFTGAQDGGNSVLGTPTATPDTQTLSMSTNSMILGVAISRYELANIELPQDTARTLLTNLQVYLAQVASALSPSLNLSGTQTFEANSNSNEVSISLVEIKESASAVAPTVTTTAISSIKRTTASSGGNVTSDGGASVTARGVCWNTSTNPTTANSKTTDGTGTGSFSSSITGLLPGTTYYVRAYATNSVDTSYGDNVSFKTDRRIIIV